jgi:4-hydroxy-2-oxoheptanedioate aldolase
MTILRSLLCGLSAALLPASLAPAAAPTPPSPVRLNRTTELLAAGKSVFGVFSQNRSPTNARALAQSTLDFVMIDMEHHPWDAEQLRQMLLGMTDKRAILAKGNLQPNVTPLVRIPPNGRENLQFFVKQALDTGAFGIMFPYVETADEAREAVRAMRFPQKRNAPDAEPAGLRGFALTSALWYWGLPAADYIERADVWPLDPTGELLSIVQIESPRGIANLDAILDVPGISAIFVGPQDLTLALGLAGTTNAPELEEAIVTVLRTCQRRGVPCGIIAYTPELAAKRLEQGFRFIIVGIDGGMTPAADAALKAAHTAAGRQ